MGRPAKYHRNPAATAERRARDKRGRAIPLLVETETAYLASKVAYAAGNVVTAYENAQQARATLEKLIDIGGAKLTEAESRGLNDALHTDTQSAAAAAARPALLLPLELSARLAVYKAELRRLGESVTKRKDARGGPADPEMQAFTDAVTRLYAQHGREFLNTRNYMPAAKALLKRAVNRQISGVALRMPPGFNWKLAVAPKDRSYDPLLRRCVNEARSVSRTAS